MRKMMAFLLLLVFVLSFAACGEGEEAFSDKDISEPIAENSHQSVENPESVQEEPPKKESLPEIDGEPLSAEEIEFFNEMFFPYSMDENGSYVTNPWSHFFTSYYDEVWEISFPMFIYYFPSDGREVDEKEFQALRKVEAWEFDNCETLEDMPVPVRSISKKDVDAVLKEYTGIITSDDLDTSAVAYLKEYDCYYNSTSDYGPGTFNCTGGERIGNTLYLYEETEQGTDMLVLIEEENSYKVVCHQHFVNP